jgi:hypothetical protein
MTTEEPERKCSNCHGPLKNLGVRHLHVGDDAGVLGVFKETDEDLLPVELHGCVACGKIDLYLPHAHRK